MSICAWREFHRHFPPLLLHHTRLHNPILVSDMLSHARLHGFILVIIVGGKKVNGRPSIHSLHPPFPFPTLRRDKQMILTL
ncbi:hypothetical protein IE53DRAFT_137807 [Violaceomyces palustris]|uniref:Uncharacterized protein n=1 Tax=Violaceomyces palustris TaxID=1673888 RepID=A0ACD0NUU1_9BASI|nr:hypothetical protein IE53DRAFT_137807 [Violaceomyces palustris]